MEDSSIEALFRQNNEFIRDLRYWLDKGLCYNDAFSKAKIPNLRIVPNHTEPCIAPIQSDVRSSLGSATGTNHKQKIVSDIGILSPQKINKKHAEENASTQRFIEEGVDKEINWLRVIGCGGCALICMSALIRFGTQAGGNSLESVFWSSLIVISSSILLALPFRWWLVRSWIQKVLGLALVGIGYMTMHASLASNEQRSVDIAVASSTGVQQIENSIRDLELRLKPTREAIARLDAVEDRKTIARMQSNAKPLEGELAAARKELVTAQEKATTHASAGVASSWSMVEWLRRLALEPLNILCLHGFIEAWPQAMNALRRRRIRFAQVAT
jgi:ferredoxin